MSAVEVCSGVGCVVWGRAWCVCVWCGAPCRYMNRHMLPTTRQRAAAVSCNVSVWDSLMSSMPGHMVMPPPTPGPDLADWCLLVSTLCLASMLEWSFVAFPLLPVSLGSTEELLLSLISVGLWSWGATLLLWTCQSSPSRVASAVADVFRESVKLWTNDLLVGSLQETESLQSLLSCNEQVNRCSEDLPWGMSSQ